MKNEIKKFDLNVLGEMNMFQLQLQLLNPNLTVAERLAIGIEILKLRSRS